MLLAGSVGIWIGKRKEVTKKIHRTVSVSNSYCIHNRVMSPKMIGLVGRSRPRVEVSVKTGLPKNWNGEDRGFYKHIMITDFEDEKLDAIARGEVYRSTLQTDNARRNYDKLQIKLKRQILSSL